MSSLQAGPRGPLALESAGPVTERASTRAKPLRDGNTEAQCSPQAPEACRNSASLQQGKPRLEQPAVGRALRRMGTSCRLRGSRQQSEELQEGSGQTTRSE